MTTKSLREFIEVAQTEPTEAQAQAVAAQHFERNLSKDTGMNVNVRAGHGVLNVSAVHTDDPEKLKHIMASLSRFAHAHNYAGIRIKDVQPGSVTAIKAHGFDEDRGFFSPNGVALLKSLAK